jgi:hypothetical protein
MRVEGDLSLRAPPPLLLQVVRILRIRMGKLLYFSLFVCAGGFLLEDSLSSEIWMRNGSIPTMVGIRAIAGFCFPVGGV